VRERPILVIGAGGLGLMCLSVLKALGARPPIVVDISEANRAAALDAGAVCALDGRTPELAKAVTEAAGGPVPAAIDFVGAPQTVKLGLDCLAKGGQLVLVGLFGGELPVSLPVLPLRAISIVGSFVGGLPDLRELLALARERRVPPIPICECALSDAHAALLALKEGRRVGRTILRPQDGSGSATSAPICEAV
jgi:alcohol dehydrogenase, propanol-preferring